jgi:glycosyltransferase involved in cell wall biosynthesis
MNDEQKPGTDPRSSFIVHRSSLGRVAVIHDWLTGMRGGEAVLEGILDLVPDAELFTLFHFKGSASAKIESRTIHTSSLQRMAQKVSDYRTLLPLYPRAIRAFDLSGFDTIISSSHCVAKGVDAKGKPHLSYCHTPMRYIWDRFDDYFPPSKPASRFAMSVVAPFLRRWDVATAAGVTRFIANSTFVAQRIRDFYGRDSAVIHPFIDDVFLEAPLREEREDYHLIVSALVPYKRIELAMEAAEKLVIIGSGPMLDRLKARAGPNVQFLGSVSREVVIDRMARARSLILPGVEDFGITPVEAMALGTPVVALRAGGALDSVSEGRTGIFFDEPAVQSLRNALGDVESRAWDRRAMREHAAAFSRARFHEQFGAALQQVIA